MRTESPSRPSRAGKSLTVAYVVSMADGLQSFVYREIRELRSTGVSVILLPTRIGSGPYQPPVDWPVARATLVRIIAAHLRFLAHDSGGYWRVLSEALKMGALLDFLVAVFFATVVRGQDARLIHCHFGDHKLFIGYFAGKLSGVPVSVTVHAYELYSNPNPPLFRRAIANVNAIVTVAEYNRSVLERKWGAPKNRIFVIPLFADIPPFHPQREQEGEKIVIATVARLVPKKGHRTLLEAVSMLPPNYETWIVGTGPLNLREMAIRLHVQDRVKLLGRVSDAELDAIYRTADIFCLPSETATEGDREGVPVALMEAMSHGLPVVATRHAGVPELVHEVLVSERDPRALADALLTLGGDRRLRQQHGRTNYDIVSDRFSRANVLLLKSVFERIAS